jgi:hypothetical protein
MIPVMTSTKTDSSTMNLAGVEAGEKMLVLWVVELLGADDQSGLADQNRRSAIRQAQSKLDFILLFKIDLLPFDSDCFSGKGTHCLGLCRG